MTLLFKQKKYFLLTILLISTFAKSQSTVYFQPYNNTELTSPVYSITTGDFNSDGKTDLAVATTKIEDQIASDTSYSIFIYLQQQDGSLLKTNKYSEASGTSIKTADINNDNRDDIVFSTISGFGVLLQNSQGTFDEAQKYYTSTKFTRIATGDLNSDGKLDICGLNTDIDNGTIYVCYQKSDGTFEQPTEVQAIRGESIIVKDINGDNKDDIILQSWPSYNTSNFAIILQTQNNALDTPIYYDLGADEITTGINIGDINGDYVKDVVITTATSDNEYSLYTFIGSEDGNITMDTTITLPFKPSNVYIKDINFDSRNDILVLYPQEGKIGLYLQQTDGSIVTDGGQFYSIEPQESTTSQGFEIVDINNDLAPDIILANPEIGFSTLYHIKPSYFIPHIASSPQWKTNLAIDNIDDSLLEILVTQRKDSGEFMLNSVFVDPYDSYIFPLEFGDWGIVEIKKGKCLLRETFVNTEENGKGIAEFYLKPTVYRTLEYVLPNYNANNLTWMGISILNPWDSETSVTLTAYNSDGNIVESNSITLNAKSHIATYIDTLFPSVTFKDISKIHLTSILPVTGINISGYNNERLLFTPATKSFNKGQFPIPHIAKKDEGWLTKLIIDNTATSKTTFTVSLYAEGMLIEEKNYTIQGNATLSIDLNNLNDSGIYPDSGFVTTLSDNLIIRESFINTEADGGGTAEFLLQQNDSSSLNYTYPFFEQNEITWMGISIFNTTNQVNNITVTVFTDEYTTSVTTITLNPYSRFKGMLSDLFPGLPNYNHIARVYLQAEQKLAGINISGNGNKRLLFGPATNQ